MSLNDLDDTQREQLRRYRDLLLARNARTNLTAIQSTSPPTFPQLNNPPPILRPPNAHKLPLGPRDSLPGVILGTPTPSRTATTTTATTSDRRTPITPHRSKALPPILVEIRQEREAMLLHAVQAVSTDTPDRSRLGGAGRGLIAWMGGCGGLGWKVLGCGWGLRDFCRRIFAGGGSLCWMIASAMSAVVTD